MRRTISAELQSIPLSHRYLVEQPLVARLTTSMPDGYPQTHPVWFTWEEPYICINTMRGFRKEGNMRADPRVSVLLLDPDRCTHWLEIHGTVRLTEDGAEAHSTGLPGCTPGWIAISGKWCRWSCATVRSRYRAASPRCGS